MGSLPFQSRMQKSIWDFWDFRGKLGTFNVLEDYMPRAFSK